MMNGAPSKTFTIEVGSKPLTKDMIFKEVEKHWGGHPLSVSTVFIPDKDEDDDRENLTKSMGMFEAAKQMRKAQTFSLKSMRIFSIEAVEYF